MTSMRVAVLASGRGSNLGALIAAGARGELPIEIVLVASDKPAAGALQLARDANIPALALDPRDYANRAAFDRALFEQLDACHADLLVLAGFMRILDAQVLAPWVGRTINIHPSLLPKYRGLHTHRRALEAGDAEHGASVHFVTAELDGGPIIAQARVPIQATDDEHSLAARLLPLEHRLLPAVVKAIAAGKVGLSGAQVRWGSNALNNPLRLLADGSLSP